MTSIKEVYQSFFVLPDNPRYLKDKRRKNRIDINHEETGDEPDPTTKRDSLDSGPFQRIDITRMRSPNIPFVGRGINKNAIQRLSIEGSESVLHEFSDGDRESGDSFIEISNSSSNKHNWKNVPTFNKVNKPSNNSTKVSTRNIPENRDEYLSHDGDGVYDDYMDSPEEIMERRPKKCQQRKNVVTFLTKEKFRTMKHYYWALNEM